MKNKVKIIFTLATALFFTSCSPVERLKDINSNKNIAKEEATMPEHEEIRLTKSILNGKNFVLSTNRRITLGFDTERMYGSTGINRYFATYKIKDNRLVIDSNMGMTRAAGSKQDMIEEFKFITSLQENNKMTFDGEKLILLDKHGATMEMLLERN